MTLLTVPTQLSRLKGGRLTPLVSAMVTLLSLNMPLPGLAAGWSNYAGHQGISFSYPADWQKKAPTDKDCLVKVGSDSMVMEVALSESEAGNISINTMAQYLQEAMLEKLPDFKLLQTKTIHFGPASKREGLLKECSFKLNDINVDQEYLFFKVGEKIYTLTKTCRLEEKQNQSQLWNQILSTVSTGTAPSVKTSSQPTVAWKVFNKARGLTFLYPSNFKEEHDQDVDHPASLTLSENGKHAHINLHCGDLHPAETVGHMADMLEEKYFATQKNYRHLHEETRSSTKQNLEAIVKEATFEANGMPLKQLTAFFRGGDKFWALTVSTNGWTANETNSLFSRILSSVELH